jgi:hypothetical protein
LLILVAAGAVAGFWGIIIAVPLAASVKVIGGHLWRTRVLGQTWEEAEEATIVQAPPPVAPLRFRTREMDVIDPAEKESEGSGAGATEGDEGDG